MTNGKENLPPIVRLKYKKGDLVIKEGDYGISIYKILKGSVQITGESKGEEVVLAILGRGEIIGEMAFLTRGNEPRAASAKALDDLELEVWHPASLSKEYDKMPPVIKYITNQTLQRLMRMNQFVEQISSKKGIEKTGAPQEEPQASQRGHYRKPVDFECAYRPADSSLKSKLKGQIKDISVGGILLEASHINTINYTHKIGHRLRINSTLPGGKKLDIMAEIMSIRDSQSTGKLLIGVKYIDLSDEAGKAIGFFMMT